MDSTHSTYLAATHAPTDWARPAQPPPDAAGAAATRNPCKPRHGPSGCNPAASRRAASRHILPTRIPSRCVSIPAHRAPCDCILAGSTHMRYPLSSRPIGHGDSHCDAARIEHASRAGWHRAGKRVCNPLASPPDETGFDLGGSSRLPDCPISRLPDCLIADCSLLR